MAYPDVRKILVETLAFENINRECQKAIRSLKVQGAPLEEWVRATADTGSTAQNSNIIGQALATGI